MEKDGIFVQEPTDHAAQLELLSFRVHRVFHELKKKESGVRMATTEDF